MSTEEISNYLKRIEIIPESDFFTIDGVKHYWRGEHDFDDLWNMKIYIEYFNLHLNGKLEFRFWAYENTYSNDIISDMSKDEDMMNIFTDKTFEKLVIIVDKICKKCDCFKKN